MEFYIKLYFVNYAFDHICFMSGRYEEVTISSFEVSAGIDNKAHMNIGPFNSVKEGFSEVQRHLKQTPDGSYVFK